MGTPYEPKRPAVLTLVAVVSFLWSGLNVLLVILGMFFSLILGAGSWILGPAVGVVGSFIGMVVIVLIILSSLMSILLFMAALHTWQGDLAGRSLHRIWAFINVLISGLALLFSGGHARISWWGLVYALSVLYVMGLPEVVAYFNRQGIGSAFKSGGVLDDEF